MRILISSSAQFHLGWKNLTQYAQMFPRSYRQLAMLSPILKRWNPKANSHSLECKHGPWLWYTLWITHQQRTCAPQPTSSVSFQKVWWNCVMSFQDVGCWCRIFAKENINSRTASLCFFFRLFNFHFHHSAVIKPDKCKWIDRKTQIYSWCCKAEIQTPQTQ